MSRRKKIEDSQQSGLEVSPLIAKKNWRILSGSFNKNIGTHEVDIQIQVGDDVSGQPEWVLGILKAENVI